LRQGSLTARRKAPTLVEGLASQAPLARWTGEYNFKLMWYGLAMAFFRESTQCSVVRGTAASPMTSLLGLPPSRSSLSSSGLSRSIAENYLFQIQQSRRSVDRVHRCRSSRAMPQRQRADIAYASARCPASPTTDFHITNICMHANKEA
jgi:hypothetical protein